MAKFYGNVGYSEKRETYTNSGVWIEKIKEYPYYGDVVRNYTNFSNPDKIIEDITLSNAISIVSDKYAVDHIFNIRYVEWQGALWTVRKVEIKAPRLELTLGSVYNGPTPESSGSFEGDPGE